MNREEILKNGKSLYCINSENNSELAKYFSDYAKRKEEIQISISWINFLIAKEIIQEKNLKLSESELEKIHLLFNEDDYYQLKKDSSKFGKEVAMLTHIEKKLNEYGFSSIIPYINIGVGYEEISNCTISYILKKVVIDFLTPKINNIILALDNIVPETLNIPIVVDNPNYYNSQTTIGCELSNYISRIKNLSFKIFNTKFITTYFCSRSEIEDIEVDLLSKQFTENSLGIQYLGTNLELIDGIIEIISRINQLIEIFINLNSDMDKYLNRNFFGISNYNLENLHGEIFKNAVNILNLSKSVSSTIINSSSNTKIDLVFENLSVLFKFLSDGINYSIEAFSIYNQKN